MSLLEFQKKKTNDKYLFDINNYKIVKNINRGGFGVVNLVQNTKTKEQFAAKTNLIQTKKQNKLFVSREVRILIQIQHSTIIRFRGFSYQDFDGNQNITILMDYMEEGSLAQLLEKEAKGLCSGNYDDTKRQIILIGIARGMMILHKNHVIHRDLKPENILLDKDFHPRITDFGLSKFFDPCHSMNQSISNTGTAAYMAPEVITSDNFNSKADVYAFGILMFEVIMGKRAYYDLLHGKNKINEYNLKTKVTKGLRPEIKEGEMKNGLQKMIEKCWSEDPKQRPTFQELYQKLSLTDDNDIFGLEDNDQDLHIIDDDNDNDEEDEESRLKKFCLDNVNYLEILDYIDEISEEPISFLHKQEEKEVSNDDLKKEIKRMYDQISSLEAKLNNSNKEESKSKDTQIEEMKSQITQMNKVINDQQNEINSLKIELSKTSKEPSNSSPDQSEKIDLIEKRFGRFFSVELNETSPGILYQLKKREKSCFDPLFIASTSSRDIYKIIDPNAKQNFSTIKEGYFRFEFQLKDSIEINGLQIFTSKSFFPRSFNIEINNTIVASIKDANELNKPESMMTIKFDPINTKKVCLIQTGPNWDRNTNAFFIRRIEILSNEARYSKGVFATFIAENDNHDPHKCPVYITSTNFNFNSFVELNTRKVVETGSLNNEWFQIEFILGSVILNGLRIQGLLKCFKVICTDDINKPFESWTTLIEVNEQSVFESRDIRLYEFKTQSPLVRFVRLIQTGPNKKNNLTLRLHHFDLFGSYF